MNTMWRKELSDQMMDEFGEKKSKKLSRRYFSTIPPGYAEHYSAKEAFKDIVHMETLSIRNPLSIRFYKNSSEEFPLHIKLYRYEKPMYLSDFLPVIENMGLSVIYEQPYRVKVNNRSNIWISDFSVTCPDAASLKVHEISGLFHDVFLNVMRGICENDGLNKLVLSEGLSWREITVIRIYAKYMQQVRYRFSTTYIEQTINNHARITKKLFHFFYKKFQPYPSAAPRSQLNRLENTIQKSIEKIISLDEDLIMRYLWSLIKATIRTNYFQRDDSGQAKDYISIKLHSTLVPDLPPGQPLYEIFVYSTRFEGVHLRSTEVARGGIRWAERLEELRTEILGLMKAQKIKNAVIVPSGAKGGFVLKSMTGLDTREKLINEVKSCYKSFIRGLLDITDNLQEGKIQPPKDTMCYDGPDPYLVVAPDKGTATFSDIANTISQEFEFWLGDAFASGGSTGYDHKKIGITARGAWESIKRHFQELGINIQEQDFTAVGIGDMSGDVFGNGLIYSKHTRLLAAFDHRHIFLDPDPDARISFEERTRLFHSPDSSWEDYNPELISKGGGIYKRSCKSIPISKEVRKALAIEKNVLAPNELIQSLLKAPVDLLFNGGIGTYVKSVEETHSEVGDKANDLTRVNGSDLRCKIVGEGGNLGVTQLGRIEYALNGGLINTDSIDNSAGVSCSDHEVNIKILLNREVQNGTLTKQERNCLLTKMTEDVAKLVLKDNYAQALVLSFSVAHAQHYSSLYQSYIQDLESTANLDRSVERFPDNKKLLERKSAGLGLVRPELAIIMAYTKIHITHELLKSHLPDDPYFIRELKQTFPSCLTKSYVKAMKEHPLRREIIATKLSNRIVNSVGITFVYRIQIETGASIPEIVKAYTIASKSYQTDTLQNTVNSLDYKLPLKIQYELLSYIRQLLNLATRWFLQKKRMEGDIGKQIFFYKNAVKRLEKFVSELMVGATRKYQHELLEQLADVGLENAVLRKIASVRAMYTVLNIIEVVAQNNFDLIKTTEMYFMVGERFNLVWFRDEIANDTREGHWNTLARLSLREELDNLQRSLTILIMKTNKEEKSVRDLINEWLVVNPHIQLRWETLLEMLYDNSNTDYTIFFIVLRQLSSMLEN